MGAQLRANCDCGHRRMIRSGEMRLRCAHRAELRAYLGIAGTATLRPEMPGEWPAAEDARGSFRGAETLLTLGILVIITS